jgi:hypothetical protein
VKHVTFSQGRALFVCLLGLAAWITQPVADAQVLYGSLVGIVQDSTGAVVPGAQVSITNRGTGQSRETTTNEVGSYQFTNIPAGTYDLSVSSAGFSRAAQTGVQISINTASRINVQLEVGEVSESVTVAADAASLQTEKADVHVELNSKEVTDLPTPLYRNYQSLINLVPGATPARTQNNLMASPGRALSTNVNGTTRNNNNNRVDGANNIRATLPHQAHYIPPLESIETVNISTNSFDADQGFAGGAVVNVVTKSGTNDLHGSLFEYHANSAFRAKDFFFADQKRPKDIINMFGGTIGGPIKRDKLFFFTSFEGLRQRQNSSGFQTVATMDQRQGDFSAFSDVIYDPLTGNPNGTARTPFAGNVIPQSRHSAVTRQMQDLVPQPDQTGVAQNYFFSKPVVFDRDNFDVKINWNASERTMVWGKYSAMPSSIVGQAVLDEAGGSGAPASGTGEVLAQLATLAVTHTFSPTFLMDAIVGFNRMAVENLDHDHGVNFGSDVLGIPGTNGPDPRQGGKPRFSISGYSTLGQPDSWMPKILFDNSFTYTANFNWIKSSHDLRFGLDISREQQNHWHPEIGFGPRGGFTFSGGVTSLSGGAAPGQFNSYGAYLLGLPQSLGKSLQVFDPFATREWRHGYYIRDRWQATPNLTVTLGLRYEYYPIMTRVRVGIERYDPVTNQVLIGRMGDVPDNAGIESGGGNFSPRVGIAYRLGSKTVIRTGYGISTDPYLISTYYLDPYPGSISSDFQGANSFQPFAPIEQGIPLFEGPDISSGQVDIPSFVTTKTIDPGSYNRGYVQSYNLTVERQLPWQLVGSIGYVGTSTVRQLGQLNINAGQTPGLGLAGRPLNTLFGRNANTSAYRNFLSSNYNSLQASLDRRFTNGLGMKIAYTFGKAINFTDDSSGSLTFNALSDLSRNRSIASYDRTHTLRLAFMGELPFGAGKPWANESRVARAVLGGWQVNGIFSAYSGLPFTVAASAASLNSPGNSQTADQVKSEVTKLGGIGPGQPYFDPAAFAPIRDARFGSTGRNLLRGPGVVNLDASLFRNFVISERFRLQFRAESFNLTNTPKFANPSANVSSGNFMVITSTAGDSTNLEGQARGFRFGLRLAF